jgi:hypothetical protein
MTDPLHIHYRHRALPTGLFIAGLGFVVVLLWVATHEEKRDPAFVKSMTGLVVFYLVLAVCGVIDLWRHWIETDWQGITKQGILRRHEMRWDEVETAVWKVGTVELRSRTQKMSINFQRYQPEQSRSLAEAIRGALPEAVHRDERRFAPIGRDPNIDYELPSAEGIAPKPDLRTLPIVFGKEEFVPVLETRRVVRWSIIAGLVAFSAVTLWLLPALLDGHVAVLFLALGFGAASAVSMFATHLERNPVPIEIWPDRILYGGGSSRIELPLQDVRKVLWSTTGLAIELLGDVRRLRIRVCNFPLEQRLPFIRRVRDGFPHAIQANWPRFCHLAALPLRESSLPAAVPIARVPGPDEYLRTRAHVDRGMFGWMILVIVCAAGTIGLIQYFFQAFTFSAEWLLTMAWLLLWPVAVIWAWRRYSTPAGGRVTKVRRWSRDDSKGALTIFAMSTAYGLVAIGKRLGWPALIAGLLVFVSPFFFLRVGEADRRLKKKREREELDRAAEESTRKWDQLDAEESRQALAP